MSTSRPGMAPARRHATLFVLCLAVSAIYVDTTIINVALPTLVRDLDATTRELQWIVDAYNLTFAALVLAGGSLGDRFGRRGVMVAGLVLFGAGAFVATRCDTPEQLIAMRAVMGTGAALIFPATLSILTTVFTERRERATAIGIWGATTGVGVALGPIAGGWLLEHYSWHSVFGVMVPVAIVVSLLALAVVPTSRDPTTPRIDRGGVGLASAAIAVVVFTIIEAPTHGWLSVRSIAGALLGAALVVAFVRWERQAEHPMLDVRIFRNRRFTAASMAVSIAFFGLFGYIFLGTQYFQFVRGYSALETGIRILPIAVALAGSALFGPLLAVRIGTKTVVTTGLVLMAVGFLWTSGVDEATPYVVLTLQMLVLGAGLGLTTAPATEAIMGAVPLAKAGVGSAVNDATRELGGTLGVAVIGSVYASFYASSLSAAPADAVPPETLPTAKDSIGAAQAVVGFLDERFDPEVGRRLTEAANEGFFAGLHAGSLVAAGLALAGAAIAAFLLPAQPLRVATVGATDGDAVAQRRRRSAGWWDEDPRAAGPGSDAAVTAVARREAAAERGGPGAGAGAGTAGGGRSRSGGVPER